MAGRPCGARQQARCRRGPPEFPASARCAAQGRARHDRGHASPARRLSLRGGCQRDPARRHQPHAVCKPLHRGHPGQDARLRLRSLHPCLAWVVAGAIHQRLQLGLVPCFTAGPAHAGVSGHRAGGVQEILERVLQAGAHRSRLADFLGGRAPPGGRLVHLVHCRHFHHRYLVPDPGDSGR